MKTVRYNTIWLVVSLCVALGVIGCSQVALPPVPAATPGIEEETVTVSPATPGPARPASKTLVMQAKEDLAERLSLQIDHIEVVETEAVIWPDSSMGCPKPGMAYTQVQHDGLRIRLRAEGRVYEYHSGGTRSPFLCEQATPDK